MFKYCRSVPRPRIKQQYVKYWPTKYDVLSLIQNWICALLLLKPRNVVCCVAE